VAAYFLDSSAVMKRYVQETGTVWVRALTASGTGNFFYLARITDVEVTAALARRRGQPGLSVVQAVAALRQFRRDFGQDYRVVEITIALLQRAAQLADTHALRGYDAVQLAVALDVHARDQALVLVSADAELNAAATAEGLRVEDPNTHP
jgi:predicted nucleic acid-binding protein